MQFIDRLSLPHSFSVGFFTGVKNRGAVGFRSLREHIPVCSVNITKLCYLTLCFSFSVREEHHVVLGSNFVGDDVGFRGYRKKSISWYKYSDMSNSRHPFFKTLVSVLSVKILFNVGSFQRTQFIENHIKVYFSYQHCKHCKIKLTHSNSLLSLTCFLCPDSYSY